MKHNPTCPARFAEARVRAAEGLEDEAVRHAREGVEKAVLHKSEPVIFNGEPSVENEYSDHR
jgi:hypothetical protein